MPWFCSPSLALLWSVLHFGRGILVYFDESQMPQLSANLSDIPYYAGRTVLRMWIAFAFSLLFTLIVGYGAHVTTACCPNGCRCELRNRKGQQQPCLL
jgi:hypothetical protein